MQAPALGMTMRVIDDSRGGDREAPLLLSVVVPAYNESARLGGSLGRLLGWLEAHVPSSEVIVVDDGSRDATAERAAGARRLGLVLREVPVHWRDDARSTVRPLRDGLRAVAEVAKILVAWAGGRYAR